MCKLFRAPPFTLLIVPYNSVYYNYIIFMQWLVGWLVWGSRQKGGLHRQKSPLQPCALGETSVMVACALLVYTHSTFSVVRTGKQDHCGNTNWSHRPLLTAKNCLPNQFRLPIAVLLGPLLEGGSRGPFLAAKSGLQDHFWAEATFVQQVFQLCDYNYSFDVHS